MKNAFRYLQLLVMLALLAGCISAVPTHAVAQSQPVAPKQILIPTSTPQVKIVYVLVTATPATEEVTRTQPVSTTAEVTQSVPISQPLIFPISQSQWPVWKSFNEGKVCLINGPEIVGAFKGQVDGFRVFNIKQDIFEKEHRIEIQDGVGTSRHLEDAYGCHDPIESPREEHTGQLGCMMLGNICQAGIILLQSPGAWTVELDFFKAFPQLAAR